MPSRLLPLVLLLATLSACTAPLTNSTPTIPLSADHASRQLFNDNWKFHLGDLNAADPSFDDSSWRTVTLPHDYSIEQPFSQDYASSTGFLPAGIAWYRKTFTAPGPNASIHFDGVYKCSSVYLNGHLLGTRPNGYISFDYDLTPYLTTGQNVLAVRVDHHDFADSRWYPGSGIFRNVFITASNPIHVSQNGTYITTSDEFSKVGPTVTIRTDIQNDRHPMSTVVYSPIAVVTTILDPAGKQVARKITNLTIGESEKKTVTDTLTVSGVPLWSPDNPSMATAVTEIHAGSEFGDLLDTYRTPFGIRSISFDPNKGFFLNGQNMKIKGVCLHAEAGALGSAIPLPVWERRLNILKEAGTNAIRTSHNPPAPEFLDLCDRMGFLVMDEAFDEWTKGKHKWVDRWNGQKSTTDGYNKYFDQWAVTDLQDMIRRDRNHPSIIMWSVGNEIDYPNDPWPPNSPELVPIAKKLVAAVHEIDTTRPATAACAGPEGNLFMGELDIVGYNYKEALYPADHARFPNRVLYGSENTMRSPEAWFAVKNNDYISAQFLWTGIDYLGEAGAWPTRGSSAGFLDLAGFKKPLFYFRQSFWSDTPVVYLTNARQFGRRGGFSGGPGSTATAPTTAPGAGFGRGGFSGGPALTVYSNCQTVELTQSGKSLGERPVPENHTVTIQGSLANGPITAIGKNAGQPAATYTLKSAKPAATVSATPYAAQLHTDGLDCGQIEVQLLDANGDPAYDATNPITVKIVGPARLLGIENGSQLSHESYQAPTHSTQQGRAIVYVQPISPGDITLTITADKLIPATVHLNAK
jgi:hypothetical protein